jgi:hypothetical protein
MTVKEARTILGGKLIFGDAQQIEAKNFLNAVEDCVSNYLGCKYAENHRGKFDADCQCMARTPDDVAKEARVRFLGGRR